MTDSPAPEMLPGPELRAALHRMHLLAPDAPAEFRRLTGGVSSDIWLVERAEGPLCVKRALAKLKVAADWRAPVERNAYEAVWLRRAGAIVPGAVPLLLGQDSESGALAMTYLPPDDHPVWKTVLQDGTADPAFAAAVAARLVRIHATTAGDSVVAAEFPTDTIFHEIRLAPYLVATAEKHPDLAPVLHGLVATTAANRRALVHGDVSPKNILVGPAGPVFLDAECAWYGDPAFDLAFCLNHMLLKCLWTPSAAAGFLACFDALAAAYVHGVAWEPPAQLEARAARLLPGLFLARVDGKSPVEYVTQAADKDRVRRAARALLAAPVDHLAAVRARWTEELAA